MVSSVFITPDQASRVVPSTGSPQSVAKIRRLLREGQIPGATFFNGRWALDASTYAEWLENHIEAST